MCYISKNIYSSYISKHKLNQFNQHQKSDKVQCIFMQILNLKKVEGCETDFDFNFNHSEQK